jgi:hypothetical protein
VHIFLVPLVINVNPMMFHNGRCLPIEHGVLPILMKEDPKPLICAPLLAMVVAWLVSESDNIPRILLIVVNLFLVDVIDQGPDLQALRLLGGVRSATMRRRVLGGGLLSERDGSCPLGKLLRVSSGSPAGARATDLLALLETPLMTFASHRLQERVKHR